MVLITAQESLYLRVLTPQVFFIKEDDKPLCGLELTVEQKIWQAMNQNKP